MTTFNALKVLVRVLVRVPVSVLIPVPTPVFKGAGVNHLTPPPRFIAIIFSHDFQPLSLAIIFRGCFQP
ncbi:MAG: hypothetical protein ACRC8Q_04680 [Aeromonas sp.]